VRRAGGRDTRAPEGYFQEFYREAAHNGIEDGFGLGLSIVMRLCDTLKHRLRMDSRRGRGTVFRINPEPHEGWSGSIGERQD
jgi:K+-sensing histidine kinase KdpD